MDKKIICFDLDGVIAKWNRKASQEMVFGLNTRYFLGCELERNPRDTAKMLYDEGFDVRLLSSYPNPQALVDKGIWRAAPQSGKMVDGRLVLGADLPMIPLIGVPFGEPKGRYIDEKNAVLVDDYGGNLKSWNGVRVKFYNDFNGRNNTHYRYSVRYDEAPALMANYLAWVAVHGVKGE